MDWSQRHTISGLVAQDGFPRPRQLRLVPQLGPLGAASGLVAPRRVVELWGLVLLQRPRMPRVLTSVGLRRQPLAGYGRAIRDPVVDGMNTTCNMARRARKSPSAPQPHMHGT